MLQVAVNTGKGLLTSKHEVRGGQGPGYIHYVLDHGSRLYCFRGEGADAQGD